MDIDSEDDHFYLEDEPEEEVVTHNEPPKTKRLSLEEERELISRVQERDDQVAFERLADAHTGFIACIAAGFQHPSVSQEDLIDVGKFGLYLAIKKFDLSQENGLLAYAKYWIRGEMSRFFRKETKELWKKGYPPRLGVKLPPRSNVKSLLEGLSPEKTESVLARLPLRQRNVVDLRCGLNGEPEMRQVEVAERLGIGQWTVSRDEKEAFEVIQENLSHETTSCGQGPTELYELSDDCASRNVTSFNVRGNANGQDFKN